MAAGDLTTIDRVRDELGIEATVVAADTMLAGLVSAASAWVVTRLGWKPLSAAYTDTISGTGSDTVSLRHAVIPRGAAPPPVEVASVTVDGVALSASAYEVDLWQVRRTDGEAFPTGRRNVVITYSVGWTLETLPEDLRRAATVRAALDYADRGRLGVGSQSGGGETVTYSQAGALAYINGIVEAYTPLVVG